MEVVIKKKKLPGFPGRLSLKWVPENVLGCKGGQCDTELIPPLSSDLSKKNMGLEPNTHTHEGPVTISLSICIHTALCSQGHGLEFGL